jgi:hypothetical protein
MAGVRCIDVPARPTAFLDFTSVTLDKFPPEVHWSITPSDDMCTP